MLKHAENGENYSGKCFVAHSACMDLCDETVRELEIAFPLLKGKIRKLDIGTVIASHCGKGTVAVFFVGDERV